MKALGLTRLFWKMFLPFAVLVVVAVGTCAVIVTRWQERQLVQRIERELRHSAILIGADFGDQLTARHDQQVQERLRALGQKTNIRYTLADVDGAVLADSERESIGDVRAMENHLGREEFAKAAAAGAGSAQRISPTLGIPFHYYALSVERAGERIGFVRAAQSMASIGREVRATRELVTLVFILVVALGLLIAYWLTNRIMRPIRVLTTASDNIAAGGFSQRIDVPSGDELGTLARSFEAMCRNLNAREQQLRENLDRQQTVLGGMIEGVLAVDSQQRVLFANQAAGKLFGFDPSSVVDQPLIKVVRSNALQKIVQRTIETKELSQGEVEWLGGAIRQLQVHATPLSRNQSAGVVLVLHDISELKRLEGMRQEFIANVSHELKTPLTSIKAYTETLLRGAMDDQEHARKFLARIEDQADRLNDLIFDMLSLARIESGRSTLEIAEVSVMDAVRHCLAEYESRAEQAQVTLSNQVPPTDLRLLADEEAVQQIIGNLVDNAIKYTPAGGVVAVGARLEGRLAVVTVADTGSGIAPQHHQRLFERFYRVDRARSRELGGTGLGLSIVKHLCQVMGGAVEVESEMNKGSVFSVRLPAIETCEKVVQPAG